MLLRSRLKKELVNLRISKNNFCIFSLVLLLGLTTISKQEKEMPEDEKLSSGYSVIRGNMVNINNYSNVSNYAYHSQVKKKGIKREYTLKEKDYFFLDEIQLLGEDEYPQGLCITDDFVFISFYSGIKGDMGKIKVYDKESGRYLISLGMDEKSHLGGLAFDGKYIWICNSSKMALEKIEYSFIRHMVHENPGKMIDARNLVEVYQVRNIPSSVTYYHGQLWVATHSVWTNSVMIGYLYNEESDTLNDIGSFRIPPKVQGVAFTETGNVILSTSYGRRKSSYIKRYDSIQIMSNNVEDYKERIELPPCSEGIVYKENRMYVLFESAGKKYLEGTDGKGKSLAPLDKILVISTS